MRRFVSVPPTLNRRTSAFRAQGGGWKGGGSGCSFVAVRLNRLPVASHITSQGVKLSGKLGGKHG